MSKKYIAYFTEDVLETEMDVLLDKLGSDEKAKEALELWREKESELYEKDLNDFENILKRFEYTIEEDDGQIWVCMKILNINRLWEMFGTKPDEENQEMP